MTSRPWTIAAIRGATCFTLSITVSDEIATRWAGGSACRREAGF